MTALRAVVFDFDGVIVESEGAKDAAFADLFGRWPDHRDAMLAFHREHRSLPRRAKLEELAHRLGRSGDAPFLDGLSADLSELMLERVGACPLVRGAPELLRELSSRVHVAIASVTPLTDLIELVRRLGIAGSVDAVYGDPPTPKAEAVRTTIDAMGTGPGSVALVGDSPADQDVARVCGVRFIGRDSGIPFGPAGPPLHEDLRGVATELRALLA